MIRELRAILAASTRPPRLPDKDRSILIYGAGNRGREVLSLLRDVGYRVVGFMDQSARPGAIVEGLPCHAVRSAQALGFGHDVPALVIAIFRHDLDLREVYFGLPLLGYPDVTPFHELVEAFPGRFPNVFWQGCRGRLSEWKEELERVFSLLADDESRRTFLECMRLRIGDVSALAAPDHEHQYCPAGIFPEIPKCRFVDCGAYDGDTLRTLLDHGIDLAAVVAFEPDPVSFGRLAARFAANARMAVDALLVPCAVWSKTTTLRFEIGTPQSGHIDPTAATVVQAVTLDDALSGFNPNWIKLDIEGAELEALSGARRIIERHRPFLSVAAYHDADHVWRLPALIRSWDLGYRFYFRYHGYAGMDTVLYARAD